MSNAEPDMQEILDSFKTDLTNPYEPMMEVNPDKLRSYIVRSRAEKAELKAKLRNRERQLLAALARNAGLEEINHEASEEFRLTLQEWKADFKELDRITNLVRSERDQLIVGRQRFENVALDQQSTIRRLEIQENAAYSEGYDEGVNVGREDCRDKR